MNTIVRVFKSIFLPHSASQAERAFIEENRQHWAGTGKSPVVLVETALCSPNSLVEKFLIAKLFEKQSGATSVVLLNSLYKRASEAYGVAASFGIARFICLWTAYAKPWFVIRSAGQTLSIIRNLGTGERLLGLHLDDIHIGDLLYDTLIRYRPNCYTVGSLNVRKHFRLIFRAVFNFHTSRRLFERYNVKAVVTSHTVYAEFGIICRIAHARGAIVFLKDMDVFRVYGRDGNIYEHFLKVDPRELALALSDTTTVEYAEQYFQERMGGKIDQVDVKNAYTGKRVYSKAELLGMFGADTKKKNVFVMSHAFSDAPHVGGKLAFEDYYVWLRETLLALSLNAEINVFVKPHPSSYMWGEKGAVETLLTQIGVTNVQITPADMNTLSISTIADYVVTARGTAGLEFSGFGIPALTCGESYYSGFGIALEATSREEYLALLSRITSLAPLSQKISLKARVLLYLTFTKLARSSLLPERHIYPGDDAARLIPAHFQKMTENLSAKGSYEDEFTRTVNRAISDAL